MGILRLHASPLPLTLSEEAELETVLAGIDDEGLRARLAELGRALYRRSPAR